MKPAALGLALTALAGVLTAPVLAEPQRRPGAGTANPSALIAAEIAFNRLARDKGQWTAFRKTAADSAVMFVPQPVLAKNWLKGRADPPGAVQWQPHEVWMSCDGTLGVTRGAWQNPKGATGYFTTIWQRQKNGGYRWILDQGAPLATPMEKPLMLSASVADCPRSAWPGSVRPPKDRDREPALKTAGMEGAGASDDGSLTWSYHVGPDFGRKLSVSLRKGGEMKQVLALEVSGEDAK